MHFHDNNGYANALQCYVTFTFCCLVWIVLKEIIIVLIKFLSRDREIFYQLTCSLNADLRLVSRLRMSGALSPLHPYVFIACVGTALPCFFYSFNCVNIHGSFWRRLSSPRFNIFEALFRETEVKPYWHAKVPSHAHIMP